MIDQNKLKRQEQVVQRWRHSDQYGATKNGSGTLWAVGGFGKTFTATYLMIKRYLAHSPDNTVTVLLPRTPLISQWKEELDKWIDERDKPRIEVVTVQTCVNQKRKIKTGLLIVDELHMFYGPKFIKYIDKTMVDFDYNFGLTATYRRS